MFKFKVMKDQTAATHYVPEWLTKEYLEPLLQKYKRDDTLCIVHFNLRPATVKGDNYASVMTRIHIEYSSKNSECLHKASYIAKISFENDSFACNLLKDYQAVDTEMLMYDKVLPQLTDLLNDLTDECKQREKLFADTIHVDFKKSAIILEDLTALDYVLVDRLKGADLEQTKLTLMKLAKMHASAAKLNELYPKWLTKLQRGLINRHTNGFAKFFEHCFEVCATYAGTNHKLGNYYQKKLQQLVPYVMEKGAKATDDQANCFMTLIHGDIWLNNSMFKYSKDETTKLQDMVLLDFQFSSWSSPTIDLHYFFNTSLQWDLRFHRQDELVQYYHSILSKCLRDLQFQGHIPSLHELIIQMEITRFYAVTSSLVNQAVMINTNSDDADFDAIINNDERSNKFRQLLYTNPILQNNIEKLLPYFDRKGLLDID